MLCCFSCLNCFIVEMTIFIIGKVYFSKMIFQNYVRILILGRISLMKIEKLFWFVCCEIYKCLFSYGPDVLDCFCLFLESNSSSKILFYVAYVQTEEGFQSMKKNCWYLLCILISLLFFNTFMFWHRHSKAFIKYCHLL